MPLPPLHRSVERPHRNLSPWLGGGLLAAGGLSALIAVAVTPVRKAAPPATVAPVAVPPIAPPAAVAPPPAPVPCEVHDKDEYDLAKWSVGPDHFGPISTCAPVTSEMLASLLPSYAVSTEIVGEGLMATYVIANRHERLLEVMPPAPGDEANQPIAIRIVSATIPTPEGIHVGDRLRSLRALHSDMICEYAGAEGDSYIYCTRGDAEDPWRYYLRLADISLTYRRQIETATSEFEIDLDRIANARIEAIAWQSGQ